MGKNLRQIPITCSGHTRPVVDLRFSDTTPYSYFLITACKGTLRFDYIYKKKDFFKILTS